MKCSHCGGQPGIDRCVIVAPWERGDVYEGHKLSQRIPCPNCNPTGYAAALIDHEKEIEPFTIAGKTRQEWIQFAREDNCLERMVPSDLRQILAKSNF